MIGSMAGRMQLRLKKRKEKRVGGGPFRCHRSVSDRSGLRARVYIRKEGKRL